MRAQTRTAVEKELAADRELLERTATSGCPASRLWQLDSYAVVAGRGSRVEADIDLEFCGRHGIPVIRRFSGGGSVMVGPGTLQWAVALPEHLLSGAHPVSAARELVTSMLSTLLDLERDPSGDLMRGDRKVGGLAIRKIRGAVLVHGSLLVAADIELMSGALRHPSREPGYRRGRPHAAFLENLTHLDGPGLAAAIESELAQLDEGAGATRTSQM